MWNLGQNHTLHFVMPSWSHLIFNSSLFSLTFTNLTPSKTVLVYHFMDCPSIGVCPRFLMFWNSVSTFWTGIPVYHTWETQVYVLLLVVLTLIAWLKWCLPGFSTKELLFIPFVTDGYFVRRCFALTLESTNSSCLKNYYSCTT